MFWSALLDKVSHSGGSSTLPLLSPTTVSQHSAGLHRSWSRALDHSVVGRRDREDGAEEEDVVDEGVWWRRVWEETRVLG